MFRTSAPVSGSVFHNRRTELQRLDAAVDALMAGAPRWLALVGGRKVGKTSLILEAARRADRKAVCFVTLDVFESAPVTMEFFRSYGLRAADRLLATSMGVSLEALAGDPQAYRERLIASLDQLPAPLRADLLALPDRPLTPAFIRMAIDLPERLATAMGTKAVVAIDEFQELAALGSSRGNVDPMPLLRSLWQKHRATAYVVSGSARTMLTELVTSKRSPFFQHFDLMEISPFAAEDAMELLTKESPAGRKIPMAVAARAVELFGGHPFYLQVFGEALVQREPPYDESDLKDTMQGLLFARTGRLALYFQNEFDRLVGRSAQLAATLLALANGPARLTEISRAVGTPSGAAVRLLDRLGDAVVKDEQGLYKLADPTFGLWLRWRAPGGSVVPMRVIGDEAEVAVAAALAQMGFDLVYQSRASRGAFDLLATRGTRQLGVQVKRAELPVRFSAAAWNRMSAEAARFGWRWIVAAVDGEQTVLALDPKKAERKKDGATSFTLSRRAVIENLLAWLDKRVK